MKPTTILAAGVSLLLLSSCGDGILDSDNEARLRKVDNSEAFFASLREGLINTSSDRYFGGGMGGVMIDGQFIEAVEDTDSSIVAASPGVSAENVTGTNVQEVGVDEQDKVKADDNHLYVLSNEFGGGATIDDVVFDQTRSTPAIFPGQNTASLRILSFQPETPDATPVAEVALGLQNRTADGMYLHARGNQQNAIVTSSSMPNYWGFWGQPYSFANQVSGVARVDVSDPSSTSVAEQYEIDGQIISSRRIGDNLIVASRYYPSIEGVDPYSEDYEQAVQAADLSTLLPNYRNVTTDETTPLVDPANCFVAPKEGDNSYVTPNIVTLAVINLNTMQLTDSTCFMGQSETLYASPDAIYLATTRWDYSSESPIENQGEDVFIDFFDPRAKTDIHEFVISGSQLVYNGSGSVKGHLGWNELRKPFRMSEKDGYLRVATYSNRFNADISPVNMTVLKANGNGSLETVSQLPNESRPEHIGKPGEQLYASRFVGDKAYLVTFRQTDPLYVIDLSNPADPILAGELEIEGYSDYLQPISEDYLLGIGLDAVEAADGLGDGRGALTQGIKLALFDVSDAAVPTEVQSLIIGQRGSYSNALSDHRAITIQPATDQHPMRVAFGISVSGEQLPVDRPTPSEASQWYERSYAGLHGFEVRTGDDAGISLAGTLTPSAEASSQWYGGVERSVLYNDSIYYIRGDQVFAAPWSQMENAVGPR